MKRLVAIAFLSVVASPLHGQSATADPVSEHLRQSHAQFSASVAALVEVMPAGEFGFRPTVTIEGIRTFGQIVAHIVVANTLSCLLSDPTRMPQLRPPSDSAFPFDKSRLPTVRAEVDARCLDYLATMTDAALGAARLRIRHDPAPAIGSLRIPVLLLDGEDDDLVPPARNIPLWRQLASNAALVVKTYPGLDHALVRFDTGAQQDRIQRRLAANRDGSIPRHGPLADRADRLSDSPSHLIPGMIPS